MTDTLDIDAIRARVEKATKGPWQQHDRSDVYGPMYARAVWGANGPGYGLIADLRSYDDKNANNAKFIAHARSDIPALLDALEASLAREAELRAELGKAGGHVPHATGETVRDLEAVMLAALREAQSFLRAWAHAMDMGCWPLKQIDEAIWIVTGEKPTPWQPWTREELSGEEPVNVAHPSATDALADPSRRPIDGSTSKGGGG